ncbi:MAG: YkgJ family cysteine cluster protein [Nitrospirota bacterium]
MHVKKGFHCIEGCVRCCTDRGNPLELTIVDILRLSRRLYIGIKDFFECYCEIVWNRIPDTSLLIPSIALIFPCGFLERDKCTIYDFRPIHCRLFPEALILDSGDLSLYRNCGYRCIDEGILMDKRRETYIHELKEIDRRELKATASYFENFKYCVELRPEEFKRISSLLSEIDDMEKAEKKRELCTETISKDTRDKVFSIFMEKLSRLDME